MQLTKLTVNQLPGIRDRFEISDLKTVNIIHGPNGSGKSSLTLAIRKLLWKEIATGSPFSVEAAFINGSGQWRASRNTKEDPHWYLVGESKTPPLLPAGIIAECYKMSVLDLVVPAAGKVEIELANSINIEMYGGIDLEKVKNELFTIRPRLANDPSNKLDKAFSDHSDLLSTQAQLTLAQKRLPALVLELEKKDQARIKLNLLENFQAREQIALQIADTEKKLDSFSPGQKNIQENDGEDLSQWLTEIETNQGELTTLEREIENRIEKISSLDFPAGALAKTDFSYLSKLIDQALKVQEELDTLQEDILTQDVTIRELILVLDPKFQNSESKPLSDGLVYTELSGKYSLLTSHLAQIQGWERIQSKFDPPPSPLPDNADEIDLILLNWMKASTVGISKAPLAFIVLGILILSSWFIWAPALAVGAVLILFGSIQWLITIRKQQKETSYLIRFCRRANLKISNNPNSHEVINLLMNSYRKKGTLETHKNIADLLKMELHTLTEQSTQYSSQIDELSEQFGLSLSESHITFLRLLDEIPAFRQAQRKKAILQEKREKEEARFQEFFLKITESFNTLAWEKPEDIKNAQHLLEGLQGRVDKLKELTEKQPLAFTQLKNLKETRSRIKINLNRLWERLEIDPQIDDQLVQSMVNKIPDWKLAEADLAKQKAHYDAKNPTSCSEPEVLSNGFIKNLKAQDLEKLQAQLQMDQDTRDDVLKEIDNTERNLKAALHSRQIAKAQAICTQAESALIETRAKEHEAQLGQLLMDDISDSYQRNSQPAVLAKASKNFSAFTQNAYELRVRAGHENQGQFFALERDTATTLALAELSDGTRAQLLLAVRLAFITENEGETHPPIFLDESLAASDPERFSAIALNLSQWAHDQNRQVFYLTSNPGDAQAWKAISQKSGLPEPKLIDLALIRNIKEGRASSIPLMIPEPPPSPENCTPKQYAQILKIPRLDGWKEHTEANLWHLLQDDLPLLHRLFLTSTPTWGRWNAHKENMDSLAQMSSNTIAMLSARGLCLELFLKNWRIGRGKLLSSDALVFSGHVSKNYLEKCRVILTQERGSAAPFIAALRLKKVPRFQHEKINLLEEFFIQEGYLDPRETLSTDELISDTTAGLISEINNGHLSVPVIRNLILNWEQAVEFEINP